MESSNDSPPDPAALKPSLFRSTWWFLWGLLFPLIYLALAADFRRPDWQSGQLAEYAVFLYHWPHMVSVYPLVAFSSVGLAIMLWGPTAVRRRGWVQLAVISGMVVWFELWIVWCFGVAGTFDDGSWIAVTILSPLAGAILSLPFLAIVRGANNATGESYGGSSALVASGVTVLLCTIPFFWVFALVPACPLAVFTYGWASYVCWKSDPGSRGRFGLKTLLAIMMWLSGNLAAWRLAINSMLAEYATLPTTPPSNCFIATAAARGHSSFVGTNGSDPLNRQLRRLKAGELVLRYTAPRLHAAMRWIYNRLGPRAAGLLTSRWLSDLAYVGLKPCEYLASILLTLAGVTRDQVDALYRVSNQKPSIPPTSYASPGEHLNRHAVGSASSEA